MAALAMDPQALALLDELSASAPQVFPAPVMEERPRPGREPARNRQRRKPVFGKG